MFETAAQTAIYGALNGNISAGVYDDVPFLPEGKPTQDFPYVVIGDDSGRAFDTDDTVGAQVEIYIHVWSRYPGMKEVKSILGEIYAILNRSNLTASGYYITDCLWQFSDVSVDPDGKTRHGVQRYLLTIQEA